MLERGLLVDKESFCGGFTVEFLAKFTFMQSTPLLRRIKIAGSQTRQNTFGCKGLQFGRLLDDGLTFGRKTPKHRQLELRFFI